MAFKEYKNFYNNLKNIASLSGSDSFIAENFILEERLQKKREEVYSEFIKDDSEKFGDWQFEHENYLHRKIYIEQNKNKRPETFTKINYINFLNQIDKNQYLVRLENLNGAISLTDFKDEEAELFNILNKISETGKPPSENNREKTLHDFLNSWNLKRDKRPIFAGFWGEIKNIFDNQNKNWANLLRDRLGLGHYAPETGENIPVLLLRYRVSEVLSYQKKNGFSIPTVLDSGFSEFFFPTSSSSEEGQTLNLSATKESAYYFNKEILHSFIEYKDTHIYRIGEIDSSSAEKCENIRGFHLNLLKNGLKNINEINKK
ncbi:MAG: hypothetical protein JRJ49_00395 [Deltaproteobacteria bacterium]|nr:hypothetical protein [Deltaproteobacteria bacterium]